jgi:hypothetical protein
MADKSRHAKNCVLLILAPFVCLAWNQQALADLDQFPDRSLEWLVDTSDVIVIATVQGSGSDEELRIDQWLKPQGGSDEISPPTEIGGLISQGSRPLGKLRRPLRESGDRLLLFARHDSEHGSRVHHLIYLRAAAVSPPESGSYKDACRGIYLQARSALYSEESSPNAKRVCAVLNMYGEILVDPEFVVESVKHRVATGPTVPTGAEVAKLENFFNTEASEAFGGFYAGSLSLNDYTPWADSWSGNDCHCILVPPEPRFMNAAFSELTDKYSHVVYAKPALDRLANYPHDPYVIEWLRTYLREGKPEKYETRTVNGKKQSDLLRAEVQKTIDTLLERKDLYPKSNSKDPQPRDDSP